MPATLKFKGGNTATEDARIGAANEITIDTEAQEIRLHDASTPGGKVIGGASVATPPTIRNFTIFTEQRHIPDNWVRVNGTVGRPYAANAVSYFPIVFNTPTVINSYGIEVTTADAASVETRIGIYAQNPTTGLQGDLLFGSAALDVSAVGLVWETLSTPLILHGTYWAAHKSDSETIQCRSVQTTDFLGPNPLGVDTTFQSSFPKNRNQLAALIDNPPPDGYTIATSFWAPFFK